MSWYRSYVQQDSGLYCSSPPSPTALWADAPSSVTAAGAAAAARGPAGGGRGPGAMQAPDHQQQSSSMPQQLVKLQAADRRDQPPAPQQQQQPKQAALAASREQAPACDHVAAGAAPDCSDPMLFRLAAALEAGWAGTAAPSTECTTAVPEGRLTGSSRSRGSNSNRGQQEPPKGSQVTRLTDPGSADGASGSSAQGRHRAAVAAAAVAKAAAGRDAASGPSPSASAAAAADATPMASKVPHKSATKAAGKGAATLPMLALPQHSRLTGQRPQQQPSSTEAAAAPAEVPAAVAAAPAEVPAAVAAAAAGAAAGADPLDIDLFWEGPGPRRQSSQAATTTSSSSGLSKARGSSRSRTTEKLLPKHQQQQQQQAVSPGADDSWEALVHSMRQAHPDNSADTPSAQAAAAANSPAGSAQAAQQQDAASAAGDTAGAFATGAAAAGAAAASKAQRVSGGQHNPPVSQQPPAVPSGSSPGSSFSNANSQAAAGSSLGSPAAERCSATAEITAAPLLLDAGATPNSSSNAGSNASSSMNAGSNASSSRNAGSHAGSSGPFGLAVPKVATRAAGDPLLCSRQAAMAPALPSPSSNDSRLQSKLGDIYPAAAVAAAATAVPGGNGSNGGSGGGSGSNAETRAPVPKPVVTAPRLPIASSNSSGGVLVFGAPGPLSPRAMAAEPASPFSSQPDVTTPLLTQRKKGTSSAPGLPASPRAAASAPTAAAAAPLLRSSSSTSSGSCLQLVSLGAARPGSSSSSVPRSIGSGLRVRQPTKPLGWWVCGGLAVAAVAGGAVAAIYGIMAYVLKLSMVYSLAWKSATGVAAAEGLALGGWSCNNARVLQNEAAKSAAELARMRKQAAQELTALRVILQQQEAAHSNEVSSLSALNERLTRLTHSLQADNSNLQGALERAAAERKALEAAAALEVKRAETSALVGLTAESTGRVVGEVEQLSRAQQALLALVHELREDLLALVAQQDTAQQQPGGSTKGAAAADAPAATSAAAAAEASSPKGARIAGDAGVQQEDAAAADVLSSLDASGCSSCSSSTVLTGPVGTDRSEGPSCSAASPEAAQCSCGDQEGPCGAVRVSSVRGGVNATLAATVSGTLDL